MRYVKEHKLQTRSRIVEMASYGLRQNGADGVSVADLMKLAGLTHGGFYSHFESRDALVVEAFGLAIYQTVYRWLSLTLEMPVEEPLVVVVDANLIPIHYDNQQSGSARPCYGAHITRITN